MKIMPNTKLPPAISEAIIHFGDNSNVLTHYFVSPTFQLRIGTLPPNKGNVTTMYSQKRACDEKDTLDNWLKKNTIPFLKIGRSADRESHLFFGGVPHQLAFCRIADRRVFEDYGAIGIAKGRHREVVQFYYRVVEVLTMPMEHGLPSRILDEFLVRGYSVVDREHALVQKTEFDY